MKKLVDDGNKIVAGPFHSITLVAGGSDENTPMDCYVCMDSSGKVKARLGLDTVGTCTIEDAEPSDFNTASKIQTQINRVRDIMVARQGGEFLFNGVRINLSTESKAKINGVGANPANTRKVVPTLDPANAFTANSSAQTALRNAADAYIQSVEDHAYDLIEALKAGGNPDIEAGWP